MAKQSFNIGAMVDGDKEVKDLFQKNTEIQNKETKREKIIEKKVDDYKEPAFLKKIEKHKFTNKKQVYIDSSIGMKIDALASVSPYDIKDITNSILSDFFKKNNSDIMQYVQEKNKEQWSQ